MEGVCYEKILLETSFSKIYIILMIIITFLVVGGYFSYAMFTVTKEKSNAISIVTGNLEYKLEVDGKESNTLVVEPNSSKEFIVTLSNPNNRIARFNFYYEESLPSGVEVGYILDCESNTLPEEKGINLEKSGSAGSSNIYKIMVENNSSNKVTITLGVSVGLDYNDLFLPSNSHLFNEYKDIPNAPELDDNMIAVTYNGSNWVKADKTNANNSWYNYDELVWANAVTVSSSTRSRYLNANVGTVVSMNDIETMWVWLPRYSYSIGSEDGVNYYGKKGCYLDSDPTQELPGEIDVRFVSTSTKDRGSAKYITTTGTREYYTPDAFTFGDEELSGLWVGKFETSSSNPSASYGGDNVTTLDPVIKPNITSWRNINVSNAFDVSQKMNNSGNRYGFTSEIDTHMMKNSEWGVVAYLSQSKYGKLGNSNFSGSNKEIYQNKSDSYITGCSWGHPSGGTEADYGCQYTYDIDINGTGASTTGNIYGIYDMSGGSWEYIMANYNNTIASSGFTSMPNFAYYDKYISDNILTACSGKECLSHSLSETEDWYNQGNYMVTNANPWLLRSSDYKAPTAGIFFFSRGIVSGYPVETVSFRLVATKSISDHKIRVVNNNGEFIDYLKYSDGSYVYTDDTVKIVSSLNNSFAMDIENASTSNAANVQLYTSYNSNAQKFTLLDTLVANFYNIGMFISNNKVLDIVNASSNNGANIQIYTSNNTNAQQWNFLQSNESGYYYIKSSLGTCIDVANGVAINNANIQSYTCNQTAAQKWKFEKVN